MRLARRKFLHLTAGVAALAGFSRLALLKRIFRTGRSLPSPRPIAAGALRPARLAARGTALIRLEAVERRAHGNLVGIARPDDEISYFFRCLP